MLLPQCNRWNILAESLIYHIKYKTVLLEGFVFMKNHIHLLVNSHDMISFIRGFKRFTAKAIKKDLDSYTIRKLNNKAGRFQFWEKTNMPVWIEDDYFFQRKLNYIHENPTRAGYVDYEEDWYWSSANENCKIPVDRSNW